MVALHRLLNSYLPFMFQNKQKIVKKDRLPFPPLGQTVVQFSPPRGRKKCKITLVKTRITQIGACTRHTSPTRCHTCLVPQPYFVVHHHYSNPDLISDLTESITPTLGQFPEPHNYPTHYRGIALRAVCVNSKW